MTKTMMQTRTQNLTLASLAVGLLFGCGGVRTPLESDRALPDEGLVVQRPPLVVAPALLLPPPGEGDERSDLVYDVAAKVLTHGKEAAQPSARRALTAGEEVLLERIRAALPDAQKGDIGALVDLEVDNLETPPEEFSEKFLFNETLDASAEAARLAQNVEDGAVLEAGETPHIAYVPKEPRSIREWLRSFSR